MFGIKDNRLRRRHIQSLDPQEIAAHLKEQLDQPPREKSLYEQWLKTGVEPPSLIGWLEDRVAKEWGPYAAARVWNIINEGFDGEVEQARNLKPHQLPIRSTDAVPGACAPVSNLFHVSQALSWIAGTRNTIPERLEYVKAIPRLMEPLTEEAA
ncbi:MAG: hypothetical protein LC126_23530 [Bryobacterales bacterium]|nr:hypothetical protein [Bryobacterales bacterium]